MCFCSTSDRSASIPPSRKGEKRESPVSWKTVGAAGLVGGAMLAYLLYLKHEKEEGECFEYYRARTNYNEC